MPYPPEYERAGTVFTDFLTDVKNNASFGSSHMAYTMAQGVFQVFRRRLDMKDAIRFSNSLPAGLRALFVADWDVDQRIKEFSSKEEMNLEVRELRPDHNFSHLTEDPIQCVAKALWKLVGVKRFQTMLCSLPTYAQKFWNLE